MDDRKKEGRYQRIYSQLEDLLRISNEPIARMATVCAVLHNKMEYFFWTGFYLLQNKNLTVGPYQGPLACQELEKNKGVCWAAVECKEAVVVADVSAFPGHIACDSRSKSEISLPVFGENQEIKAVFDVDSVLLDSFNNTDRVHLEKILALIYA